MGLVVIGLDGVAGGRYRLSFREGWSRNPVSGSGAGFGGSGDQGFLRDTSARTPLRTRCAVRVSWCISIFDNV